MKTQTNPLVATIYNEQTKQKHLLTRDNDLEMSSANLSCAYFFSIVYDCLPEGVSAACRDKIN